MYGVRSGIETSTANSKRSCSKILRRKGLNLEDATSHDFPNIDREPHWKIEIDFQYIMPYWKI